MNALSRLGQWVLLFLCASSILAGGSTQAKIIGPSFMKLGTLPVFGTRLRVWMEEKMGASPVSDENSNIGDALKSGKATRF